MDTQVQQPRIISIQYFAGGCECTLAVLQANLLQTNSDPKVILQQLCDMPFKLINPDQLTKSTICLMYNVLYISLLCHFNEKGTSVSFMTVH